MAVDLRSDAARTDEQSPASADDRFIRLRQVLKIHHATAPAMKALHFRGEPTTLDDCLFVTHANIRRYHFAPPLRWVTYPEVPHAMAIDRAARGGHNHPYARELVFGPVKVVLAEADPIRAVLTYEPCYPSQMKLAMPRSGQRLWMIYAAVAVLNSRFGRACYRANLSNHLPKSRQPHGLKLHALEMIPVARADWDFDELGRVADLTYQLLTLHEAADECLEALKLRDKAEGWRRNLSRSFQDLMEQQNRAVEDRLHDAIRQLLGLSEAEEDTLLTDARAPESARVVQQSLFEHWDMLPSPAPPPPVSLLGEQGTAFGFDGELRRLLLFWQDAINSRPPRELYSAGSQA